MMDVIRMGEGNARSASQETAAEGAARDVAQ
jgi:hypothetical protein